MSSRSDHRASDRGLFEQFVHSEVSGSVILLLCTIAALVLANSPWAETYFHVLHTKIGVSWGGHGYALSLHHWINDGLMVIFFFVVGLEVKRELVAGHLSAPAKAILPVSAALGGMVAPAALYALLNTHSQGSAGWGIPMATDIAFALGILAVFGKRVPIGLKVFLAATAIADDIGAVLVIAIFYTEKIRLIALGAAALLLVLLFLVTRVWRIRRPGIALLLIVGVWVAVFASGVHATVAGILVALLVPVRSEIAPERFLRLTEDRLARLRRSELTPDSMVHDEEQLAAVVELREAAEDMAPTGLILEQYWHPVQAFFILPLFALANAGVALGEGFFQTLTSPVGLGIVLGLVAGKQAGIMLFSWAAIRSGWADMPQGVTWTQLYGASCLAGVGFTMSLFIGELAFADAALVGQAKVGILVASLVAAVCGLAVLQRSLRK